jgi:hypothetical protein
MKRGVLGAICVALGACGSFGAAPDPVAEPAVVDGGPDGGGEAGGPVTGDAASSEPVRAFCAGKDAIPGFLFCADFDGANLEDGWSDRSEYYRTLLGPALFGANRAAGVSGFAKDKQADRLRSMPLAVPASVGSVDIELKIRLTRALSKAEIATIEGPEAGDNINLYLDGSVLKIRTMMDSAGVQLDVGVWSTVKFHAGSSGMTLTGPKEAVGNDVGNGKIVNTTVQLSVGMYFKQDDGELDYALDDVLVTAK